MCKISVVRYPSNTMYKTKSNSIETEIIKPREVLKMNIKCNLRFLFLWKEDHPIVELKGNFQSTVRSFFNRKDINGIDFSTGKMGCSIVHQLFGLLANLKRNISSCSFGMTNEINKVYGGALWWAVDILFADELHCSFLSTHFKLFHHQTIPHIKLC